MISEEKINDNTTIRIIHDEYADNPKETGGQLNKMFCFHKRYNLGDKHDYSVSDFSSFNEMKEQILKDYDVHTIFPVYLYDHSGITISTQPFHCPWDSGQVGWVFITNDIVEEFEFTDISDLIREEVKWYDSYLTGSVYAYQLIQNDEIVETIGGYLDCDECLTAAKEHIKELDEA